MRVELEEIQAHAKRSALGLAELTAGRESLGHLQRSSSQPRSQGVLAPQWASIPHPTSTPKHHNSPAIHPGHETIARSHPRSKHGGPTACPELAVQCPDKCAPPANMATRNRARLTPLSPPPGISRCQSDLQRCCPSLVTVSVFVTQDGCPQ